MKTRRKPTAKLPKGRVSYALPRRLYAHNATRATDYNIPVAVLPAATKAQAKQMVKAHKFLAMTREEQVEALARRLHGGSWTFDVGPGSSRDAYYDDARAVLAAIYSEAKK